MVKDVSDSEFFTEMLKDKGIILLELWAEWCGPCKKISPMIEKLSEEFEEVKFLRANVDKSPRIVSTYHIKALPNILLIKDGSVVDQLVGVYSIAHIRRMIEEVVEH